MIQIDDSSMISSVLYDEEARELTVRFVSGETYVYSNVPQTFWDNWWDVQSKGRYFDSVIKKHPNLYPFRRVTREAVNAKTA